MQLKEVVRRETLEDLKYLKNYKLGQVTTHSHTEPPIPFKSLVRKLMKAPRVKHSDFVKIEPRESFTFQEIKGPGIVSHMWMTIAPTMNKLLLTPGNISNLVRLKYDNIDSLKLAKLKIYFDGKKRVDAPFGDFYGVGFGEHRHYHSRFLGMTSGGYICNFQMPFWESCRVEVENISNSRAIPLFYGAITYQKHESLDDKLCYFNAKYREEKPVTKWKPYNILEASGKGHFKGCVLSMKGHGKGYAFLEGNLKAFIDSEEEPSIEYTGTEDYFDSGWYFNKGCFYAPYHGLTIKDKKRISAYRSHRGGMPFKKNIKVLIHHGEYDEVEADYSSVAYYYIRD